MSRLRLAPVLAAAVAAAAAPSLVAQQAPAAAPRLELRLGPDTLPLLPLLTRLPLATAGRRVPAGLVGMRWERETRRLVAQARQARRRGRLLAGLGLGPPGPAPADTAPRIAIPRPEELAVPEQREPAVFEALGRYADLGLDVDTHVEMKLDRLRNARCTALDVVNPASGCRAGFPTPSFDQQFRVRAGGIVSERLHLDVDFDSEREFSANNTINVWYQGLEDEIVRRVDVGNVTFDAPRSRFVTAAIPANSFGVKADAQLGPADLRLIVAQQKGSALRTRTFTVGETTTQPVDFEARDLDFERGRFFFVVNPRALPDYPAVDVLGLAGTAVPDALRPVAVRVYRLHAQGGTAENNLNLGGIDAVAVRSDSPQRVGPFSWELLVESRDYYLDASGAWFAMATRVGSEDFLAVSYVTAAGDTVGTFPAVNGTGDTLELIHEPRRGPEVPTFWYEMRNVYRVGGADVERASIDLTVLLNESERPAAGPGTYLSRLGLALASDASRLDPYNRVFPRTFDPGDGAPLRGRFVVFPHLAPFADSARLAAAERNDSLYRTPAYLLDTQGPPPRFALRFHYEASGAGDRTTLSLGALQVREGSERLFVAGRELVRGRDYEVDYAIGQVRFLRPDSLFQGPTEVRAQYEENQLFDVAPKDLFGLAATYHLSRDARLHAVGLFQSDRTTLTRPQLGFEPQSGFMGGVSGELQVRPDALTRALDALPLIETTVPSRLDVSGELAVSRPNPNRLGLAWVDDFQQEGSFPIRLLERSFHQGSAPSAGAGLPATHLDAVGGFAGVDAAPLVWQNVIVGAGGGALEFGPQDIDSTIALTGTGVTVEPVLWLSLKPDTVGGAPDPATGAPRWHVPHTPGPRWGSVTQPLGGGSGVGVDLSRMEFLEFWVLEDALQKARAQDAYLVLDFGTVFEDAVGRAPERFRVEGSDTVFTGLRFVGQGRLDTERDTLTGVYNALVDDVGIRGDLLDSIVREETGEVVRDVPLCDLGTVFGVPVFPRGDLGAVCTRHNGRLDTEDMNGDNRLDVTVGTVEEDVRRYVFRVGDAAYYVRDGVTHLDGQGRPLTWRLYRIPFRAESLQIGNPNLRQVRALRLALVTPDQGPLEEEFWIALARMRLVGAPWIKRAATPIAGLGGREGAFHGAVVASVVGTDNADLGYTSPPGLLDVADRREAAFQFGVRQVNERSLRLLARDLRAGERAEAFTRFTDEADKNFLAYRKLRVWARGRGPGWQEGDLEFFIKVGRDENNFYLYRAPLRTDTWEPEIVIELDRWLALRAAVEAAWLAGAAPSGAATCGGDSTAYVACDGPYLVQLRDPGVAPPNLARVSEVAVGMHRVAATVVVDEAELWVDDIRLSDVVDDAGLARALDVRLSAADVAELTLSHTGRDDRFRQLGQNPTYLSDVATRFGSVVRLDKALPHAWGLSVPLSIQHLRTRQDPFYVNRTDLRADELASLRRPRGVATTYDLSVRRVVRGTSFLERAVLDPLSLTARHERARTVTSQTSATMLNRRVRLAYSGVTGARTVPAVPAFLVRLVEALPDWIAESEFGRALRSARLRWNPYQLRFASTLAHSETERFTYRVPVELAGDTALVPLPSVTRTWRNEAGLDLRPFSSLSLRLDFASARDLHRYGDSTTMGRLLQLERRQLGGIDVGFERSRSLTTALSVAPVVSSWVRPRFVFTSNFSFTRDPNRRDPVRLDPDSSGAFRPPETLSNARGREMGAALDLGRLWTNVAGDSGFAAGVFRGLLPANVAWRVDRRSSFDGAPFAADLAYHLALGGLDAFRAHDGVPATAAGQTTSLTGSGGTRLPLGAMLRFTYRDTRNTGWLRRGEEQTEIVQRNREWPSLAASWTYTPRWALGALLGGVTAQAQYRVTEGSSVLPARGEAGAGGAGVSTTNRSEMFAPSATLTWRPGLVTALTYTSGESETVTSGNVTRSEREDWTASATWSFRPPRGLLPVRNRVQTTLAFTATATAVCLLRTGAEECRTVADSRRQQLDLRMDTGFSPTLRGGLTFSYVLTDQRHTANKLSQIVFTVFADINLLAGQLR